MKILLILDRPDDGDVSRLALDICRNAARFGLEVGVATLSDGILADEFRSSATRHFALQRQSALDINCVHRIRRAVREFTPAIVHSLGIPEALHATLATLGSSKHKRVMSLYAILPADPGSYGKLSLRLLTGMMSANIIPLRSSFPALRRAGMDTSRNFFLLPNAVDKKRLMPAGEDIRQVLGLGEKDFLVGMNAPFDPDSGTDQLTVCRAFEDVLEKFPGSRLIFAGEALGEGMEMLNECVAFCEESGIAEKVFFAGSDHKVSQLLDALDVFVFSSTGGPAPLPVYEAMMVGLPVIVSDTGELAEITDGGKRADMFVRGDSAELSNKLISLMKSEKLRKKRSKEAMEFAAANYSIDKYLVGLKTLYESL